MPKRFDMRAILFIFVALAITTATLAGAVYAAPLDYTLQPQKSEVGFIYRLSGAPTKGQMPVQAAAIAIDFDNLTNSRVDVTVDVRRAKAGLIFATEALKARSVLNAKDFPTIRFVSTRIRLKGSGISDGARIDGRLTIRGVTRPVTLDANLYRQRGTEAGDRSRLSFRLTGAVNRSDFGATGYADLVRDQIDLDIVARISR